MIRLDAGACILGALLLLLLPPGWFLSGLVAALLHEACHILVLVLTGGKLLEIRIRAFGCEILACGAGKGQDFCSILAGPLGSLSLVLLRKQAPMMALFGLFQGLYNLLPVLPLDGGRVLALALEGASEKTAGRIKALLALCSCVIVDAAAAALFPGAVAVLGALLWNWQMLKRNIPCKQTQSRVQ